MKIKINNILSNGYVFGSIKTINYKINNNTFTSCEEEIIKLKLAIDKSLNQVDELKKDNPNMIDYLLAVELMLKDHILFNKAVEYINSGLTSKMGIYKAMMSFIDELNNASSSYLSERVTDLEDVLNRILLNLDGNTFIKSNEKIILFTNTVYPSILINNIDSIVGVIAKRAGFTSHSAILCRSYDIPFVLVDDDVELKDSTFVIIDTRKNEIITNPTIKQYEESLRIIKEKNKYAKTAISHDGYNFLANISTTNDLKRVLEYNFDGIGLFRTELIFMNKDKPYTKDEQAKIYTNIANKLGNKYVAFRTFDIGDDKKVSYINTSSKGIGNYLNNKEIFLDQVLAILESNTNKNVKIMFPMIRRVNEFNLLKSFVIDLCNKHNCNMVDVGMMLETKDAIEHIDEFKDVDFISIGTNDLIKELYGIDRENGIYTEQMILDLLKKLEVVVNHCNKYNICLSICGELAAIEEVAIKFYNMGIKNLSVAPSMIQHLNNAFSNYINNN